MIHRTHCLLVTPFIGMCSKQITWAHVCLPVFLTALSKPHLLEGKGHNRQSSDSSVDRFIPKEEVLEPAELDNKVNEYTNNTI